MTKKAFTISNITKLTSFTYHTHPPSLPVKCIETNGNDICTYTLYYHPVIGAIFKGCLISLTFYTNSTNISLMCILQYSTVIGCTYDILTSIYNMYVYDIEEFIMFCFLGYGTSYYSNIWLFDL